MANPLHLLKSAKHGSFLGLRSQIEYKSQADSPALPIAVASSLRESLFLPVDEFLSRSSKHIRADLVRAGYEAGGLVLGQDGEGQSGQGLLSNAASLLESLHAGSLVVDDVQDGSQVRRGQPTLHETIGIPKAINAGNWLYFFPLESIQSWGLTPQKEVEIYRACHRALLDAHLGQALDLGLRIDEVPKEDVSVICQYSARWKSGALTALALEVGAILGEVPNPVRSCLCEFGLRFGESLQNFDDIGNVSGGLRGRIVDPKRFEDLRLRRPTFVWSILARHADANEYQEFLKLLNGISDFTGLEVATIEEWWRVSRFQSLARLEAVENLKEAMAVLSEDSISRPALQIIEKLNSILMEAYG